MTAELRANKTHDHRRSVNRDRLVGQSWRFIWLNLVQKSWPPPPLLHALPASAAHSAPPPTPHPHQPHPSGHSESPVTSVSPPVSPGRHALRRGHFRPARPHLDHVSRYQHASPPARVLEQTRGPPVSWLTPSAVHGDPVTERLITRDSPVRILRLEQEKWGKEDSPPNLEPGAWRHRRPPRERTCPR